MKNERTESRAPVVASLELVAKIWQLIKDWGKFPNN
jgi:hypothetical protein